MDIEVKRKQKPLWNEAGIHKVCYKGTGGKKKPKEEVALILWAINADYLFIQI